MTTYSRRASVSLAASTILAFTACATVPQRPVQAACVSAKPGARSIRFDNESRERVHVYLVGQNREWSLGRVEPGAATTLRIPVGALSESAEFMRLAVIAGDRTTLRAAGERGVQLTIAQPALHILSQRWSFAQGQLNARGFAGSPTPPERWCSGSANPARPRA